MEKSRSTHTSVWTNCSSQFSQAWERPTDSLKFPNINSLYVHVCTSHREWYKSSVLNIDVLVVSGLRYPQGHIPFSRICRCPRVGTMKRQRGTDNEREIKADGTERPYQTDVSSKQNLGDWRRGREDAEYTEIWRSEEELVIGPYENCIGCIRNICYHSTS